MVAPTPILAATNKFLAKSNKSKTGIKATKKTVRQNKRYPSPCACCRRRFHNTMTLQEAKSIARHLGLTLRRVRSGAYRVNFRDGDETTAYYTDSLEDAAKTAVEMARTRDVVQAATEREPHRRHAAQSQGHPAGSGGVSMADKVQKPSRERGLLSGGLVTLTVALALVASLLYAQPVIRAYWWVAAAAVQLP